MNIQNGAPYQDDYDASKDYTCILAVPGRTEQAREFTQAQTIQRDYLERLGSAVFKDGYIASGCGLVIGDGSVTIQPGRMFLAGLMRNVYETTVQILGVGEDIIYAKLLSDIVDESIDSSLRDPAQGYENYGQPGAHRSRERVVLFSGYENKYPLTDAVVVFTLQDGVQVNEEEKSSSSEVTDTLARRTFDENGNYKISGLSLRDRTLPGETDRIPVSVTEGKAYIYGYEVVKSTTSTIFLEKADTTRQVSSESQTFTGSTMKFMMANYPVKHISSLSAIIKVTDEPIQRLGSRGGMDALLKNPVYEIIKVNDSARIYTQGVDYRKYGDSVDWSPSGSNSSEPELGTTYYVTYTYTKTMVEGVDFRLINDDANRTSYIEFLEGGDTPEVNKDFNYFYDYYLSRRDLIMMDSKGSFQILKGSPDKLENLMTPYNMDSSMLELGYVDVQPNSLVCSCVNYMTERLTQSELYKMYKRLEDMEYNQALEDLDNEAAAGQAATSMRGIYTDGFIGLTKCDLSDAEFDCCIDYERGELTLPSEVKFVSTGVNNGADTNIGIIGRVISAPFREEAAIRQNLATGTILVNPYASYNPLSCVTLSPQVDNWTDTENIRVYDNETRTVSTTSYRTVSKTTISGGHFSAYLQSSSTSSSTSFTGSSVSTSITNKVSESLIEYMRIRTIAVEGTCFEPGQDNIECFFNDERVPLTPTGLTQAGTSTGTVRADANGRFTATFEVVPFTPCGTVLVKLVGASSEGSAEYSAKGVLKTTTTTSTTTTTNHYNVLITTTNHYVADPIAQTFVFSNDTTISKAGLYFSAKDVNRDVVVQVREVVNGYPGSTVYAEAVVPAEHVVATEDGSIETTVKFNQPVYCEAGVYYCIVILSDSNAYALHIAELGKQDKKTGNFVTSNPYAVGVMFSSSNANTWTAHQAEDLKFVIYKCVYTGGGVILFDDVSVQSMKSIILAADYVDYKNSGITWYYRTKGSVLWSVIDAYVARELDLTANTVQLKAELNVSRAGTSPLVAEDTISLAGLVQSGTATYVSKSIELSNPYTKLKIMYQTTKPTEGQCTLYYKDSPTGDWVQLTSASGSMEPSVPIDDEFDEYVWNVTTLPTSSSRFFKIKAVLTSRDGLRRPRMRKLRTVLTA